MARMVASAVLDRLNSTCDLVTSVNETMNPNCDMSMNMNVNMNMSMSMNEQDDSLNELWRCDTSEVDCDLDLSPCEQLLDTQCDDDSMLRVASLNVGLRFASRIEPVCKYAAAMGFDLVALQEVGIVSGESIIARQYGYELVWSSHEHAGVALLIQKRLAPRKRTSGGLCDGRLMVASFEFPSATFIAAAAYFPSGLDQSSLCDEKRAIAGSIVDAWRKARGSVVHCVLMGDLNQTTEQRYHDSAVSSSSSSFSSLSSFSTSSARVHSTTSSSSTAYPAIVGIPRLSLLSTELLSSDLQDAWAASHDAKTDPGFTYQCRTKAGMTFSRIDYILPSSSLQVVSCSVESKSIFPADQLTNYHSFLSASLRMPFSLSRLSLHPTFFPVLNFRRATDDAKDQFVHEATQHLLAHQSVTLEQLSEHATKDDVDCFVKWWSADVLSSAKRWFGMTRPAKPSQSRRRTQLEALRTFFVSSRNMVTKNVPDQQWWTQFRRKLWRVWPECFPFCPSPLDDSSAFSSFISSRITVLNRAIRMEKQMMTRSFAAKQWSRHDYQFANQILSGDKPGPMLSLIDPRSKKLTADPNDIKRICREHFSSVFHADKKEEEDAREQEPAWFTKFYQPKKSIDVHWYDNLMAPFSPDEVVSVCRDCDYHVAAGPDDIGAGVWRLLVEQSQGIADTFARYMSACVRLARCPSSGKRSIIVAIPKKSHVECSTSNIRPISLQNAIVKILMKGLASRLVLIFHRHPILHPAQEAFLKGGAAFKCVDMVLDIWEIAAEEKRGCFNLFYDLAAAYDTVRRVPLLRALRRLCLPDTFVALVSDSLLGLQSCVRTAYGYTKDFPIQRSIRQGDPLAPLLFICFMDSLHCGFEVNPMHDSAKDGFVLAPSLSVASKGYADDTYAVSESLPGLHRMNDFASCWAKFNLMSFHPKKSILVGRDPGGECMVNANEIVVNDVNVEVTPLSASIDYVGGCIAMDLSSHAAVASVSKSVAFFSHLAHKYRMRIDWATFFFNTYLLPRLEHKLRHVQPTQQQAHEWDMSIVRCFNSLSNAQFCLKPEALSLVTGIRLPSVMEKVVKLSEGFLRLNGTSQSSVSARLRWQARNQEGIRSKFNRLTRLSSLANELGWGFESTAHVSVVNYKTLARLSMSSSASSVSWSQIPPPSLSSASSSSIPSNLSSTFSSSFSSSSSSSSVSSLYASTNFASSSSSTLSASTSSSSSSTCSSSSASSLCASRPTTSSSSFSSSASASASSFSYPTSSSSSSFLSSSASSLCASRPTTSSSSSSSSASASASSFSYASSSSSSFSSSSASSLCASRPTTSSSSSSSSSSASASASSFSYASSSSASSVYASRPTTSSSSSSFFSSASASASSFPYASSSSSSSFLSFSASSLCASRPTTSFSSSSSSSSASASASSFSYTSSSSSSSFSSSSASSLHASRPTTRSQSRLLSGRSSDRVPSNAAVHHFTLHDETIPLAFDVYEPFGSQMSFAPHHHHVRAFTDGSAPVSGRKLMIDRIRLTDFSLSEQERKRRVTALKSAWAIVYEGDYHLRNWSQFPTHEDVLRVSPEMISDMFGGVVLHSTSTCIFMAELQAITRVLLSLPVSFSITIITDSLSSIKSISAWMTEVNERKRLRMPGRPLLAIVAQQINLRCAAGATVALAHEKSHSNLATIESRGNAMADYWADEMRGGSRRIEEKQFQQFDLKKGEMFVCLRDSSSNAIISSDIRSSASSQFALQQLKEWMDSKSQGAFADEHVLQLSEHVFDTGTPNQMSVLLLILTNTIHYKRVRALSTISFSPSSLSSVRSSSSSSCLSSFSSSSSSSASSSSSRLSQQRHFEMKETCCLKCNVCASVSHLLLFCQQYQKERDDITSSLRSSLLSMLTHPHLPFSGRLINIEDCDFIQLLFILISLSPGFHTVNQHPIVRKQTLAISKCFPSPSQYSFHQYSSCLSCFLPSESIPAQQQYKPSSNSESAFIHSCQFPSNVLTRWAFGGFGYDEFSIRLKTRVQHPKELRVLYSYFQDTLFQYAFTVCSSFIQALFMK